MDSTFGLGGRYIWEHVRGGEIIDSWSEHNVVPTEGLNYALAVGFGGQSPFSVWYLGLFSGNYTPVVTDNAATFGSLASEAIAYDEASRQVWTASAPSGGSMTNAASKASFTFNATVAVYGSFLASSSAKAATNGVLGSAGKFPAVKNMTPGDVLRVTYAMSATAA